MRDNDPCRIHEPTLAALDELDELALDPDAVEAARAHLAQCPRCQARRRMWARLDDALRDALSSTAAPPALSTADLLAAIGADHEPSERRTPMLSVIYIRDEEIMDDEQISATPSTQTSDAPITTATGSGASTRNFAPLPALKPDRQMGWRRALTGLVAVAVVIALLGSITGVMALTGHLRGAQTTTASKLDASATQTAQAATPTFPPDYQITALSMDSATDGWAVLCNMTGDLNTFIILHISNSVAVQQTTLKAAAIDPTILQALSPTNVWLMFSPGTDNLYHYDGSGWMLAHLPAPANAMGNSVTILSLEMLSPTEGFAIGAYSVMESTAPGTSESVSKLIFYRYDGSTWSIEPAEKAATVDNFRAPSTTSGYSAQITGLSAMSGGDVWATGYLQMLDTNGNPSSTTGFIYHRQGGVWRLAQTLRDDALYGVAMTGPNSGWIIGQHVQVKQVGGNIAPYKVTTNTPIVLQWNGASWSSIAIPHPDQTQSGLTLTHINFSSPTSVWITGQPAGSSFTTNSPYASDNSYLIHYDGTHWSRVSLPQVAAINPNHDASSVTEVSFDITAPTSSGDLWIAGQLAIGTDLRSSQHAPLLYRYFGGQWTNIPLPAIKSTGGSSSGGGQPAG
jgi:anti-sigma factor RsiW